MSSSSETLLLICLLGLALIAFIAGVVLLIQFARTRKVAYLIIGLLLTFLLPGILCCLSFLLWAPHTFVVYGPPPSNYIP
jgi:uncharacterized membrane protein YkgB